MSEEEIIETFKHWIEYEKANKEKINKADELIEIQQGLLDLYKQEKEKNKKLIAKIGITNWAEKTWSDILDEKYVSKDKIKEKIEDYEKMIEGTFKDNTWYGQNRRDNCYEIIRNLKELLGED